MYIKILPFNYIFLVSNSMKVKRRRKDEQYLMTSCKWWFTAQPQHLLQCIYTVCWDLRCPECSCVKTLKTRPIINIERSLNYTITTPTSLDCVNMEFTCTQEEKCDKNKLCLKIQYRELNLHSNGTARVPLYALNFAAKHVL